MTARAERPRPVARVGSPRRAARAAVLGLLIAAAPLGAQPPDSRAPTLEERVGLLEQELTNLQSRLSLGTALGSGALGTSSTEAMLATRVGDLERNLSRLATDIQRLQQTADGALREATQARREAQEAQRAAREAANRIR